MKLDEMKQRLDPKCWKGKHKEGTKIKGGIRVNNCVPNESVEEAVFAPKGPRGFDPESADFIITMDGRPYMTVTGHSKAMEALKALAASQAGHKWGVQSAKQGAVAEDFNAEYDDEAGMAQGSLHTLKNAVEGLSQVIDQGDNLPEWCQEKISLAEDYLVTVWDYLQSEKAQGIDPEIEEMYEAIDSMALALARKYNVSLEEAWESFEALPDNVLYETAAWRRKEGKSKSGGLNAKGVASYRREHPGSKLQTAVTTKPSKLKPGSKAAKRRKSFCARMSGVKGPMKKPNGKPTRKALALRKWNC